MGPTMNDSTSAHFKARSQAAFDAQAATYDTGREGVHARMLYPHIVYEVARAVADVPAPRILDLGCGTGALAELVMNEIPNCQLTGIDLSSQMVESSRTRLVERAEVLLGDAECLPFRDGSFDVVYCNDSFHHYPNPRRAAFQVWRALAQGGVLVIGDAWQPAPGRAIMNAWMPHAHEGDIRIYSEGELREILGAWFDTITWRRIGITACIAVAHKGR